MKKIIVLLLGMLLSFPLFSQEDLSNIKSSKEEFKVKTLFGKESRKHNLQLGYFIEMNAGYTEIDHKATFLPGMNFGMIFNHNWSIGLSGSVIANPGYLYFNDIYYGVNLAGGYGGGLIEYTAFPRSVVHFSIPVMIGGGYFAYLDNLSYGNHTKYDDYSDYYDVMDYTVCFVVEPGIKVEFNLFKMLRLGVGASYRYSPNFNLNNTSDNILNQFTGRFSLRFGKF